MVINTQSTDTLTLTLVKNQTYIDITEDDVLLNAYISSSLSLVQKYLNDDVLTTSYLSEDYENIIQGNYLILNLKNKLNTITLTLSDAVPSNILTKSFQYGETSTLTNVIEVNKDFYCHIDEEIRIDISNIINYDSSITIQETEVVTGNDSENIQQARLIIIAGWYANREPSTNMSSNNIPFSASLLLDLEENSSI